MSLGFRAREVPILHLGQTLRVVHSQCPRRVPLSFPCESQSPHPPPIIKSLRLGPVQELLI